MWAIPIIIDLFVCSRLRRLPKPLTINVMEHNIPGNKVSFRKNQFNKVTMQDTIHINDHCMVC